MAKFFEEEKVLIDDSLEQLEKDSAQELDEVAEGFRSRMKKENDRFVDVVDSGYWFCVCFTSAKQKEEFLDELGIPADEKYIDGREMARAYRKALKTPDTDFPQVRAFDKDYLKLAMD